MHTTELDFWYTIYLQDFWKVLCRYNLWYCRNRSWFLNLNNKCELKYKVKYKRNYLFALKKKLHNLLFIHATQLEETSGRNISCKKNRLDFLEGKHRRLWVKHTFLVNGIIENSVCHQHTAFYWEKRMRNTTYFRFK